MWPLMKPALIAWEASVILAGIKAFFIIFTFIKAISIVNFRFILQQYYYSRLSLNGHLYKMDTSVKRTLRVGPCLSLLPLFDSL